MCGIIGYVGLDDAKKELLKGLQALEYRGYDSAGIGDLGRLLPANSAVLFVP